MKKYILVHDCGYVVQPGDTLTFENNAFNSDLSIVPIGSQVTYQNIAEGGGGVHTVNVGGDVVAWFAERFDCSIMEVEDEEVHPSS